MKKTKWWAILLVILCTLTLAVAQILWKISVEKPSIFNYHMIMGFLAFGISGLMLIFALKWGELSVIHPLVSLSLVWLSILAPIFLAGESMTSSKWLGVGVMISGVMLIGYGGKNG